MSHLKIKQKNLYKKELLKNKISNFFDESYFDVQGLSPGNLASSIDEQYLARILTKLAIGSATVWWSLLEVKDFIVLRKLSKGSNNDISR